MGRWCPTCGGWCAGSCCASCVRFVFAVLFPLFWTVIQHGCWVRLLIGSLTLCGWGSIPLLSAGVHAPACWGFPRLCSGWRCVGFPLISVSAVFAWLSRRVGGCPLWGVRVFPVYLRLGRCRCCCVRVGNARSPCLGMVWFPCVVVLGVGDDGMPRDCACWVRLRGFLACSLRVAVFSWCRVRFRVVACGGVAALVCASFTGADSRCVSVAYPACLVLWRGVLLCASRCRSVVCLPFVCGGSALCLFVAVCVV